MWAVSTAGVRMWRNPTESVERRIFVILLRLRFRFRKNKVLFGAIFALGGALGVYMGKSFCYAPFVPLLPAKECFFVTSEDGYVL